MEQPKLTDWITDIYPDTSGSYLTTVKYQPSIGTSFFQYIAYFDEPSKKWYRYDPFNAEYKPTQEITNMVIAWSVKSGVFIN